MSWTAIVPIKPPAARKRRLATVLDDAARVALTDRMLAHVLSILAEAPSVAEVAVLAAERPRGWGGRLIADAGRGLNAELDAACAGLARAMVLHADLPRLTVEDVEALAAAGGIAIAPDRHSTGTNAVALSAMDGFRFAFGPGSFARHLAAAGGRAVAVRRDGLAFDVDLPGDLLP